MGLLRSSCYEQIKKGYFGSNQYDEYQFDELFDEELGEAFYNPNNAYKKSHTVDKFYEPFDIPNKTISLYLYVFLRDFAREFNDSHCDYLIDQFNILFTRQEGTTASADYICNILGNTFLHEICEYSTDMFCFKMFEFFLAKGVDPTIKNNENKTCIDLLHKDDKIDAIKIINKLKHKIR